MVEVAVQSRRALLAHHHRMAQLPMADAHVVVDEPARHGLGLLEAVKHHVGVVDAPLGISGEEVVVTADPRSCRGRRECGGRRQARRSSGARRDRQATTCLRHFRPHGRSPPPGNTSTRGGARAPPSIGSDRSGSVVLGKEGARKGENEAAERLRPHRPTLHGLPAAAGLFGPEQSASRATAAAHGTIGQGSSPSTTAASRACSPVRRKISRVNSARSARAAASNASRSARALASNASRSARALASSTSRAARALASSASRSARAASRSARALASSASRSARAVASRARISARVSSCTRSIRTSRLAIRPSRRCVELTSVPRMVPPTATMATPTPMIAIVSCFKPDFRSLMTLTLHESGIGEERERKPRPGATENHSLANRIPGSLARPPGRMPGPVPQPGFLTNFRLADANSLAVAGRTPASHFDGEARSEG